MTLVQVAALLEDRALVEIEATAVDPEHLIPASLVLPKLLAHQTLNARPLTLVSARCHPRCARRRGTSCARYGSRRQLHRGQAEDLARSKLLSSQKVMNGICGGPPVRMPGSCAAACSSSPSRSELQTTRCIDNGVVSRRARAWRPPRPAASREPERAGGVRPLRGLAQPLGGADGRQRIAVGDGLRVARDVGPHTERLPGAAQVDAESGANIVQDKAARVGLADFTQAAREFGSRLPDRSVRRA